MPTTFMPVGAVAATPFTLTFSPNLMAQGPASPDRYIHPAKKHFFPRIRPMPEPQQAKPQQTMQSKPSPYLGFRALAEGARNLQAHFAMAWQGADSWVRGTATPYPVANQRTAPQWTPPGVPQPDPVESKTSGIPESDMAIYELASREIAVQVRGGAVEADVGHTPHREAVRVDLKQAEKWMRAYPYLELRQRAILVGVLAKSHVFLSENKLKKMIGDFLLKVEGSAELPLGLRLIAMDSRYVRVFSKDEGLRRLWHGVHRSVPEIQEDEDLLIQRIRDAERTAGVGRQLTRSGLIAGLAVLPTSGPAPQALLTTLALAATGALTWAWGKIWGLSARRSIG